jgi:hypothetical protein
MGQAQSLAEAAQKEKERRESLKGKTSVVVTNADLANVKKKPAVAVTASEVETAGEEKAALTEGVETISVEAQPAGKDVPSPDLQSEALKKYEEKKAVLEDTWAKAKERVELLNLKMSALSQQFYSFNSMTPKDQIQKAISETFLKLQEAQAGEAKAKEELDKFLALSLKEKLSLSWIK